MSLTCDCRDQSAIMLPLSQRITGLSNLKSNSSDAANPAAEGSGGAVVYITGATARSRDPGRRSNSVDRYRQISAAATLFQPRLATDSEESPRPQLPSIALDQFPVRENNCEHGAGIRLAPRPLAHNLNCLSWRQRLRCPASAHQLRRAGKFAAPGLKLRHCRRQHQRERKRGD